MEIVLNDYHKKSNAIKMAKVAYWKAHPLSRTESLRRLKLLREQRLGDSEGLAPVSMKLIDVEGK